MHLQVGDNLHGVVQGGRIVLVPCNCLWRHVPSMIPEIKLPAFAEAFFPVDLIPERDHVLENSQRPEQG